MTTYSQKLIKENADENPNYFLCSRKHVARLKLQAEKEAEEIMRDFFCYYSGDIKIIIEEKEHPMGWSIAARLLVNGETVREEDPCDLLFIDMNQLVLKRMLEIRQMKGDNHFADVGKLVDEKNEM